MARIHSASFVALAAILAADPRDARAEEPPPEPPPEPHGEPGAQPPVQPAGEPGAEPAPVPAEPQPSELDALKAEVQKLRSEQARMKAELEDVKRRQSEQVTVLPPPKGHEPALFPLRPFVGITLRYDNIFLGDDLDRYSEDVIDGLRIRARAGLIYDDKDAAVNGGVRFSLGEDPNPTDAFVSIGDGFRATSVGLDRYWASFRPLDDRTILRLSIGKMPQPFWRGDRGTFTSELIWDDDISPAGAAAQIKIFDLSGFVVDNTFAYFVLHDLEDLRFQGLTGPASFIGDQIRVHWTYITGAFAFYDYENINTGLSAPAAQPDNGQPDNAPPAQTPADAFLLRPGFQATNNDIDYGSNARGFVTDAFRIIESTLQGHLPLPFDALGKGSELYLLVDFSHNLSVDRDQNGVGGSAGFKTGDFEKGWLNPFEIWFTYRYVEADAALATFADGDLGAGTGYRGFEIGASYDLHPSVRLEASYFDFIADPFMENQVRRVFVDAIWTYGEH